MIGQIGVEVNTLPAGSRGGCSMAGRRKSSEPVSQLRRE